MLVYRVEDENGNGPYRCIGRTEAEIELARTLCAAHTDSAHPTPLEDFRYHVSSMHVCAFTCLDALLIWFDGFLEDLHNTGHNIKVYDLNVDSVYGGHTETKQCVILKEDRNAFLVETLELV